MGYSKGEKIEKIRFGGNRRRPGREAQSRTCGDDRHKTVALVNTDKELGGAGINTGTLPSKTLRETALALSGAQSRKLLGLDIALRREATVNDLLRHQQNVKTGFNAMLAQWTESLKIYVFPGTVAC